MSDDRCLLRGAAAVALSVGVVFTSPLGGAEPEERSAIACDLRGDLSVPSGRRLVVHHPGPEQERRLAAARPRSFGPFDRGVYGFERVLFYVDVPEPDGSWRVQEADLLIRLDGPRSPWFRMVESGRRAELPQLSMSRGPEGQNVRAATPDPAVPLFVVELTMNDGRSDVTSQYLVDLRPGRPRVPALLECVEVLSWGACGAWDAGYSWPSGPVACAWERDRGDFQCRETSAVSTPWGSRTSVREFALLSAPEREETRATRLASELGAFAASAAGDPSARRDVETIGPSTPWRNFPAPEAEAWCCSGRPAPPPRSGRVSSSACGRRTASRG